MSTMSAPKLTITPSTGLNDAFFVLQWAPPSDSNVADWDCYIIYEKKDGMVYRDYGDYQSAKFGMMIDFSDRYSERKELQRHFLRSDLGGLIKAKVTYTLFCGKKTYVNEKLVYVPVSEGDSAVFTILATAPQNLKAVPNTASSGDAIALSWEAATGRPFSSYQILGTILSSGEELQPIYVDANTMSCSVQFPNNVSRGSGVSYRVSAYDGETAGMFARVQVSAKSGLEGALFVKAENVIAGKPILVTWGGVAVPDGTAVTYYLYRALDDSTSFEILYAGPNCTFTDTADNKNWSTVQYRVQAEDQVGFSEWYTVRKFSLPSGGRLELLQNRNEAPVYPVTILDGVFRRKDSKTLAEILDSSGAVAGPAGPGVPTGGAAGQLLAKRSSGDYDTEWVDAPSSGGTTEPGTGGVTSFKGRTGAVTPQSGDYTADQVGAVPTSRKVNGQALSSDITLITCGTADLTAGSSPLAAGTLYGVYEV